MSSLSQFSCGSSAVDVLILCEYPTLNGGEQSMLSVLGGVQESGVSVTIAAPPEGPLAEELHARGLAHVPWKLTQPNGQRLPLDELRTELAEIISRVRPTLVHANSLSMTRISGPVVQQAGLPSIGHLRDIVKLNSTVIRDCNLHTRLLAVSAATRDWHVAQGMSTERVQVAYNGIDLNVSEPRAATGWLHEELGVESDAMFLVSIGQIGMRKGTDVLFEAAARLFGERRKLHLLVIGERSSKKAEAIGFEAALHQRANELPLAGRVHFLGRRSDVAAVLSEATLLVHAARQEPLGRVLLEAAAVGTPVVATDVGGTREIFPKDADAATIVGPDDPSALSTAIVRLLDDPRFAAQQAKHARNRVCEEFSVQTAVATMMRHYHAVVRER